MSDTQQRIRARLTDRRLVHMSVGALVLVAAVTGGCRWTRAQENDNALPAQAAGGQDETQKKIKALAEKITDYMTTGDRKSAAYQINLPYLLLCLEKARMLGGRTAQWYTTASPDTEIANAEQALKMAKAGTPIYEGTPGLQERAYLSSADQSPQPYWVYVPKGYTKDKAWPLMIFLHGYDPAISKVNAWLPHQEVFDLMEKRGYLMVIPYGRRNTDFVSIGEVDTLTVLSECKRLFNVDPDRTYLAGVSMGGYGVYAIGMHYPDLWAAIAPASGRTDHYFWQKLVRENVAGFKRFQIDGDNPWDMIDNLRNLPAHLQQGEFDQHVDPAHSRRMIRELDRRGYDAKYEEIRGKDHYIYWETDCYTRIVDWFDKHPKRNRVPKTVTYTTFMPKYRRAYWVGIDSFQKWGRKASVKAEARDDNSLEVTTENVAWLALTMEPGLIDPTRPVTVRVNGEEVHSGKVKAGQRLTLRLGEQEAATVPNGAQPKSWQLSGPIREAYNGPFMIVYGTKGDDDADQESLASAQRAALEWHRFADGIPPVKADADVTDEDMKSRSLILYGDERTNEIVARVRDKLPFPLDKGTVRIGERTYNYDEDGLGYMLCYPNPLATERLVVVCAGLFWGDALPINHKFDLLPDYIVYSEEIMPSDKTNQYLCAGFFDKYWNFDEELVWRTPVP